MAKKIHLNNRGSPLESTQREEAMNSKRAKKYWFNNDIPKPREVKDILDFPTSFLAHLERARKEKD